MRRRRCNRANRHGMQANALQPLRQSRRTAPPAAPAATSAPRRPSRREASGDRRSRSRPYREVTLPAGTVLPVDLETAVGSDISRVEQRVDGTPAPRRDGRTASRCCPPGTAVSGHVTAARAPGQGEGARPDRVALHADSTRRATGTTRISTATISRHRAGDEEEGRGSRSARRPPPARSSAASREAGTARRRAPSSAAPPAPATCCRRAARKCASARARTSRSS